MWFMVFANRHNKDLQQHAPAAETLMHAIWRGHPLQYS
jgi:hypothetical protein